MFAASAHTIVTAPRGEFWVTVAIVAIAVGVLLPRAWRSLSRKRLIEDMPTSRLRSAAQGYVELVGTARVFDGEPIVAPLSGRPCCWYRYRVERRGDPRQGRSEACWQCIESGESTDLFMLDDGGGRCAIDPEGATVTPSDAATWYGSTRVPPRLETARRRPQWWRILAGGSYRYREELIEIGAPLYALGFLRTHGGAATPADTDADVVALLREWKADRRALLARFDADGDGQIDGAEWEDARREAALEVARSARDRGPPAVDLLSRPAHGNRPFLLAARREGELIAAYRWASVLGLALGTATAVALVWAVTARISGSV